MWCLRELLFMGFSDGSLLSEVTTCFLKCFVMIHY